MAEAHREWYDAHASMFSDAAAIELGFVGLSLDQQRRLNDFKLWALDHEGLFDWRGKDVLEFGAGHGRFALELQGYRSYVGVDFSGQLVRIGRARIERAGLSDRAQLHQADCYQFDAPAASFDAVCSLGMLPYIDDLGAMMRTMARFVKPGGCILGDFHHSTPLYDTIRAVKWRLSTQTGGASRVYSGSLLYQALAAAGLTDIRIVMREYPLLASLYAERGWDWPLHLRNILARQPWLNWLATDGFFAARKPLS